MSSTVNVSYIVTFSLDYLDYLQVESSQEAALNAPEKSLILQGLSATTFLKWRSPPRPHYPTPAPSSQLIKLLYQHRKVNVGDIKRERYTPEA